MPIGDQFLFIIDPGRKVEAVGDIDLGGQPDLRFRNATTGLVLIGYLDGSGGP
ncbi:MAG: hypothetical protein IPP91_05110 [Betaproteobacteria bacterium]|nr:hypothetical protein [Betaproteobacteria bacterium]